MTRNRLPHAPDERLDRLGRAVIRAHAEAGREAAKEAASSPFLYARVRARVAERRQAEADGGWLALLAVARRAVPTMAFAAAAASALLLWFAWFGVSTNGQLGDGVRFVSDEVIFGAGGGVESAVLAGGDSALSPDEILRIVEGRGGEREAQGR